MAKYMCVLFLAFYVVSATVNGYTKPTGAGSLMGSIYNTAGAFKPMHAIAPTYPNYAHVPSQFPVAYASTYPMSSGTFMNQASMSTYGFMPTMYHPKPMMYPVLPAPYKAAYHPYDPHQQTVNKSVLYSVLLSEILRRVSQG